MRFLVLVAIEEEYLQARSYLKNIREVDFSDGTIYEEGEFVHDGVTIDIILVKTGMGNTKSGIISSSAISKIKPDYLFYVGIAGGIKDVGIGDVIVAEKFYYYENGKVKDKFHARPEASNSDYKIVQRASIEARKDDWKLFCKKDIGKNNKVVIGNICSGEKVVATSDTSSFSPLTIIKEHFSDAQAVDMESGGIITSTWVNAFSNVVIIRGISDMLSTKDQTDIDGMSREKALNNAFGFAFHMISKINQFEKKKLPSK